MTEWRRVNYVSRSQGRLKLRERATSSVAQAWAVIGLILSFAVISPTASAERPLIVSADAFVGGLDGQTISSTFETGGAESLPTRGWTNVSGAAQIFDLPDGNGTLIGTAPYDNYEVEYSPSLRGQPPRQLVSTERMGQACR